MSQEIEGAIVRLMVANFKKIKVVDISPDPLDPVVQVAGRNRSGKSSTLDAITTALYGAREEPKEPVRRGEKRADILLETSSFCVEWSRTRNGRALEVTSKEPCGTCKGEGENEEGRKCRDCGGGGKVVWKKPQEMLNKLIGPKAFDALEFSRMSAKERVEILRRLAGADTSEIDRERRQLFEQRTEINRDLEKTRAQVTKFPTVEAPDVEVDLQELLAARTRLADAAADSRRHLDQAVNTTARARADLQQATRRTEDLDRTVRRLRAELEAAETQLVTCRAAEDEAKEALQERERAEQSLTASVVVADTRDLDEKIAGVQETNRRVEQKRQRAALIAEGKGLRDQVEALTATIEALDAKRTALIAAAKFPVPGLGFDDGDVTLNDLPWEQASGAEQLIVGVAVGAALNPGLRISLIDEGAVLDDHSLEELRKFARDNRIQVWIVTPESSGDEAWVIEDGQLVSSEGAAA
jgi:DNA repair exonuclease SbcCD ATPase subunit